MRKRFLYTLITLTLLFLTALGRSVAAQDVSPTDSLQTRPLAADWTLRTNLIWWGVSEPNLGFEIPVSEHWTLGGNFALKSWPRWMPWDWDNDGQNRHWRNFAIVPEVRWWPETLYRGWFAGADFIYTHFNVGAVTFPFGLYKDVRTHRLQGSWWGGGLFGGYAWTLGEHWRIEAEAGLATGLAAYDRYECPHCGTLLGEGRKIAVVPKLGVNLAWNPVSGSERAAREQERREVLRQDIVNLVSRPVAFVVHLRDLKEEESEGDRLAETRTWVIPIETYRPLDYQPRPGRDSVLAVSYPHDSHVLDRNFGANGAILDSLTAAIRTIQSDPRSEELLISIVGLASIEGPVRRNDSLSARRARSVAEYLTQECNLEPRQIELVAKGEAWDWLNKQLDAGAKGLNAGQIDRLREILAQTTDPDQREKAIRADAALYNAVSEHLLADQRTAGYIRVYYGDGPDPVAEKYNHTIYPLLKAQRYREAVAAIQGDSALLARVQDDAEAANAYGIACYFTALDDKDEAAEEAAIRLIQEAARDGSAAAAENLRGIEVYGPARKEYDAWLELNKTNN